MTISSPHLHSVDLCFLTGPSVLRCNQAFLRALAPLWNLDNPPQHFHTLINVYISKPSNTQDNDKEDIKQN